MRPSPALLSRAAHKALVPTIRLARYPSTGLPVKLSQVAYLASQRMSGYELVDEDEVAVHRRFPASASDTSRSITSASGSPAAAIILG